MSEPSPVTLEQQIAEVKRELAMRERCYPKWCSEKRMLPEKADKYLSHMRAVLRTLTNLQENTDK
jgi:hypothetical protein